MAVKTRSNRPVVNGDWSGGSSATSRSTSRSTSRAGGGRAAPSAPGGLLLIGFLALLDGAWGGIVPYLGPTFGYSSNGVSSFSWTTQHSLLYLIPGAVAVFCAFCLFTLTMSKSIFGLFGVGTFGLLLAACGAWFILGVVAWPILYSSPAVFTAATPTGTFVNLLGYNLGPGIILALLGGMALGVARGGRRA